MILGKSLQSFIATESLPSTFQFRSISLKDIEELGKLYYSSYEPGEACNSLEEATNDIKASFEGKYGSLWLEVSFVVYNRNKMVGAIMIVRQNSWDSKIVGPFIIELFTDKEYRRQGIAQFMIKESCRCLSTLNQQEVFLNVDDKNLAAISLYKNLGFTLHNSKPI